MKQLEKNHPVRKILHMQKCYPETVRRLNDPTTNELKKTSSLNQTDAGFAQPRSSSSSSRWHRGISPNTRKAPGKASTQASSQRASERESGQASKPATLKHVPHQPSSETAGATHNINSSKARRGGTESVASDETQRRRQRVAHEYEFCHAKMAYNRTKGREAEVDGILTGRSPVDKTMPLFPARATHQQLLGLTYRPINPNNPAPEVPRERKWLGDNVGWEGKFNVYDNIPRAGQIDHDLVHLDPRLPLRCCAGSAYSGTNPTQDTCARSCRLYGSHPAT